MAMITTITRLPPDAIAALKRKQSVGSVGAVGRTGLQAIDELCAGTHPVDADHLLLLSRKLARQTRDEAQALAASIADGLD